MKSLSLLHKNKKGVGGLEFANAFMIGMLSFVLIAILMVIVLNSINTDSIKEQTGNNSTVMVSTVTGGIVDLFDNIPTIFVLVGIVLLISVIAIVIYIVKRFDNGGSSGGMTA